MLNNEHGYRRAIYPNINTRMHLKRQGLKSSFAAYIPCADMEPDEMRYYIYFLLAQLGEKWEQLTRVSDDYRSLKQS